MIYLNKLINYLKFIAIFLILELLFTFVVSLLNLLGLNSGITTIIIFILNILLFFILSLINASKVKKKGFLEGIILGLIFIILMILIKIILFDNTFNLSTFIYYLILLLTSLFGGMIGVNKKEAKK